MYAITQYPKTLLPESTQNWHFAHEQGTSTMCPLVDFQPHPHNRKHYQNNAPSIKIIAYKQVESKWRKKKVIYIFRAFFQLYNISNKKMHNRIAKKHKAKRKKVNRMNGYQENIQGIRFKQMLSMFQQIKLASIFER